MPGVSVLIRARNEALGLPATLAAIGRQRIGVPVEVVVVDSASTDATVEVARAGGARVVDLGTAYRPGLAVNRGMRECRAPLVVLVSASAFPADDGWLAALVAPLDADREGRLAGTFGRHLPVPGVSPIEEPLLGRIFGDHDTGAPFSFTNAAVRRAVWEEHPCDETIASGGGDDREWAARVARAGYAVEYVPGSAVHRSHGLTAAGWYARMTADAESDRITERAGGAVISPGGSRAGMALPTLAHLVRGRRWADLARSPLVVGSIAAGRWAGGRPEPPRRLDRAMRTVGDLDDRVFAVKARSRRATEAFLRGYWAGDGRTAAAGTPPGRC
ncbi:MAG: glycosyltransferase family 2 protein [Thermoleophilia bacterium]